jgi:hypothetical protein
MLGCMLLISSEFMPNFPVKYPECNFIDEHYGQAGQIAWADKLGGARIELENFEWSGEGSGRSYEILEKEIVPLIWGNLEVLITWEGGDSHSGLIVEDGKIVDSEVEIKIKK